MKPSKKDHHAITTGLSPDARAYPDRAGDKTTNRQWCERELKRLLAKGDTKARIVEERGEIWITRRAKK